MLYVKGILFITNIRFVNMATCDPLYSSLAVSVAINEALELVRFPLVAITTPYVVRFVRRWFPK